MLKLHLKKRICENLLTRCQLTTSTLYKTSGLGIRYANGVVYAFSEGMPIQLKRMRASGARGSLPADQDGMGQYGADLEIASQSNGSY
jgi:hypothetical protein